MSAILRSVFSGPGAVIVQLMGLAIGTWAAEYISTAMGKGQVAQLIRLTGMFVAVCIMFSALWKAVDQVAVLFGF